MGRLADCRSALRYDHRRSSGGWGVGMGVAADNGQTGGLPVRSPVRHTAAS